MKKRSQPVIIAVDIDDTLVYSKFPAIVGLKPGAVKYVNKLYDQGNYIILWTCRSGYALEYAINYLKEAGLKFHQVNEQHSALIKLYGSDSRKLSYDILVCDKNLNLFGMPPWWLLYLMIRYAVWRVKKAALENCKPEHFIV